VTEVEGQGNSDDVKDPPAGLVPHNMPEHLGLLKFYRDSEPERFRKGNPLEQFPSQ
jgi:hypothetical protein